MRKWLPIAVIPVAVLLLGPLVVPALVPWLPMNNRVEEINIKTGQVRAGTPYPCLGEGRRPVNPRSPIGNSQ